MCGLTGFVLRDTRIDIEQAKLRLTAMTKTIEYRGPDDYGVWSDGNVGLGFARLAIIDLSSAGHQPMSAMNGNIWLTFNGEIYNFLLIRKELEKLGHNFNSYSDSEVILNGYIEWGDAVLERLRGMFAIAIWDGRTKRLMLARDRVGKKPLVYTHNKEGFFFGSEIKTILAWPSIKRTPNLNALHNFLTYAYIPAPHTSFEDIYKLPPAHKLILTLDPQGQHNPIRIERYWQLPEPRPNRNHYSEPALIEELVHNLDEAVKIRMMADVPLGAFLSGGVDSSAIVAMMARNSSQPIKTFSIGFDTKAYDETDYAKVVAQRYQTDHHVFKVKADAISILPKIIHHYNEPFADSSAIPSFYLAQLAKQHVTVTLNGDGGDEAFLGYNRYRSMEEISKFDHINPKLRNHLATLLRNIPTPGWKKKRKANLLAKLSPDTQTPEQRYSFAVSVFSDINKIDAYGDTMKTYLETSALEMLNPYFNQAETLVCGANWSDIHFYLPDDLLVKVDIATMAHSLESRSPFLDHIFLEWANNIPSNLAMSRTETKAIFKKAMEPYLPNEILYRSKMGFGCPVDEWFRYELKDMAYDTLLSDRCSSREIIQNSYTEQLLDEHCNKNVNHSTRLWTLLIMELWFNMWIDDNTH